MQIPKYQVIVICIYERLESVRIGKCIGKCLNWKVSDLESVRIGEAQNWKVSECIFLLNWKVSESESVRIGKCQNRKVSESERVRIV